MSGKRTQILERILKSNDPIAQYRTEFARAMRDSLHDQRRGRAEQIAEKVYADFRKKRLTGELDQVVKDYAGIEPATKPHRDSTRYNLDAWQPEKAAVSGAVKRVNPPSLYAHSILDPLASNIRQREGGGALKAELSAILATLEEQKQEVEKMAKVAKSLLSALESFDATPHKITWTKLDPMKGALPRTPPAAYGTGRWPPESKSEQQRAAELFPQYKYWKSLADEMEAPELSDELAGWYTRADPLKKEHDRLLREYQHRAIEGDPRLIGELDFDEAAEVAEREIE